LNYGSREKSFYPSGKNIKIATTASEDKIIVTDNKFQRSPKEIVTYINRPFSFWEKNK
jgi:hypothetical protein